jgi:hypothetical protein
LGKTFEWNIVIDPWPIPQLHLKCEKTSNNTLRLTWEEPDPYYGEVDHYDVSIYSYYSGDSHTETNELFYDITLPDDIDYFYIEYRVTGYFKENYLSPLSEQGYISSYY